MITHVCEVVFPLGVEQVTAEDLLEFKRFRVLRVVAEMEIDSVFWVVRLVSPGLVLVSTVDGFGEDGEQGRRLVPTASETPIKESEIVEGIVVIGA